MDRAQDCSHYRNEWNAPLRASQVHQHPSQNVDRAASHAAANRSTTRHPDLLDSTLQSALREMRRPNVDDPHLNAEEFTALYALHEGSARYPPWLQRLPREYDGKSLSPPTRTAGGAAQQRDHLGYLFSRLLL
jgi:hypothetical protein